MQANHTITQPTLFAPKTLAIPEGISHLGDVVQLQDGQHEQEVQARVLENALRLANAGQLWDS